MWERSCAKALKGIQGFVREFENVSVPLDRLDRRVGGDLCEWQGWETVGKSVSRWLDVEGFRLAMRV